MVCLKWGHWAHPQDLVQYLYNLYYQGIYSCQILWVCLIISHTWGKPLTGALHPNGRLYLLSTPLVEEVCDVTPLVDGGGEMIY